MAYTKESLDKLRQQVNLVEVLSAHLQLSPAGVSYKALCPFHEEKTPSFVVKRGDSHYHCFGCGAHGDAISFLMTFLKMSFAEAAETLAERFQVALQKTETHQDADAATNKVLLKEILEKACALYHFFLLHSESGHKALAYLFARGMDLHFICQFRIGYAPAGSHFLQKLLHEMGYGQKELEEAGLLSRQGRDFFSDRITFPIEDIFGSVVGFSARKFKEETFGGKYINTAETALFKKSQLLFGLSYCRLRIAKERRAIIVEGQVDALRLIYTGFNFTVAGQGTAFGEGHARELMHLGVQEVYLALDGDEAGRQAAIKIGNIFQKKGIAVRVVSLKKGKDPDSFLREEGAAAFQTLLDGSEEYLSFLVRIYSEKFDPKIPAQKNHLVQTLATQIRGWDEPVMVHESLKKLAELTFVPEHVLGTSAPAPLPLQRSERAGQTAIDPDRILEGDLIHLLLFGENRERQLLRVQKNLSAAHFRHPLCRTLFAFCLSCAEKKETFDLLSCGQLVQQEEDQKLLYELVARKVNLKKADEIIEAMLVREWMHKREEIKKQMEEASEEERLKLAKTFDALKKEPPKLQ